MTAAALAVTAWVLPGVRVDGIFSLALAGLVLGFVNAVVRPLLLLVTLPFTLLTLGLFYFVVNGLAFGLAAFLVPRVQRRVVLLGGARGVRGRPGVVVHRVVHRRPAPHPRLDGRRRPPRPRRTVGRLNRTSWTTIGTEP